jgi:Cell morphogenesis N-terminal
MTINRKMLSISANHRANAELYATLLGQLANVRYKVSSGGRSLAHLPFSFQSVTDRFLKDLKPLREGAKITKEEEARLESMLQGLKHVQLKARHLRVEGLHEC